MTTHTQFTPLRHLLRPLLLCLFLSTPWIGVHAQAPIGTLTCVATNQPVFSAPAYGFDASPGVVAFYLAANKFGNLAGTGGPIPYTSCQLTNGSNTLTFPQLTAGLVQLDAYGARVQAAVPVSYSTLIFNDASTVMTPPANLPGPATPVGTLTCGSGVSTPVYNASITINIGSSTLDFLSLGANSYAAFANAENSGADIGPCTLSSDALTISLSGLLVNTADLIAQSAGTDGNSVHGVYTPPATTSGVFTQVQLQAVTNIFGASAPAGASAVTALHCTNPTLNLPLDAIDLQPFGPGLERQSKVLADPSELAAIQQIAGQVYGSCTLGSGSSAVTLGSVGIGGATLQGNLEPGSGNGFYVIAGLDYGTVSVNGITAVAGASEGAAVAPSVKPASPLGVNSAKARR